MEEFDVSTGAPAGYLARIAQRYAQVHDAAEAYLSDVPGPVKKSLPGYKHAERRLGETLVAAFSLNATEDKKASVEHADEVIGRTSWQCSSPTEATRDRTTSATTRAL